MPLCFVIEPKEVDSFILCTSKGTSILFFITVRYDKNGSDNYTLAYILLMITLHPAIATNTHMHCSVRNAHTYSTVQQQPSYLGQGLNAS